MFRNLEAEMARNRINKNDLAKLLEVRYATVLDRMNGRYRFYFDDVLLIRDTFFPKLTLEYLFENDKQEEVGEEGETV